MRAGLCVVRARTRRIHRANIADAIYNLVGCAAAAVTVALCVPAREYLNNAECKDAQDAPSGSCRKFEREGRGNNSG